MKHKKTPPDTLGQSGRTKQSGPCRDRLGSEPDEDRMTATGLAIRSRITQARGSRQADTACLEPSTLEQHLAIIRENRGFRFDPQVAEAFFTTRDAFHLTQLPYGSGSVINIPGLADMPGRHHGKPAVIRVPVNMPDPPPIEGKREHP